MKETFWKKELLKKYREATGRSLDTFLYPYDEANKSKVLLAIKARKPLERKYKKGMIY